MPSLELNIGLVFLFLLLHAFFSLAETSVLNVRKSRLREMLEDEKIEDRKKRRVQKLLDFKVKPEGFIATVESGAVLSTILSAAFGTFIAYDSITPWLESTFAIKPVSAFTIALIVIIFLLTLLNLTFGALIPKSIALLQSQPISLTIIPILSVLNKIVKPLTHLPVMLANTLLGTVKDRTSFVESRISEEEIRVMIEESARSGVLDKTENELIENIFEFRERTVREIMLPRTKIVGIDVNSPRERVIEDIISEGYTRLPVYEETLDNIIGIIYSKDVLALIEHPDLIILFDIVRPPVFVPETKLLSELLREFQIQKLHMAIVIDEFGGTAGLITLEDILEEIVGEIHDEYDEEQMITEIDEVNRTVLLSTNYSITDANECLEKVFTEFRIPEDEEYESVSGYVNKLFGHIPETGEQRETQGILITVVKRTHNRVTQVRFTDLRKEIPTQTTVET